MKVTWLGHACILVQTSQGNILTDPWLVDPCMYQVVIHAQPPGLSVDNLPPIDVICITHAHYDHFDPATLKYLPKNALVIIPPSPVRRLKQKLRNLGFTRIQTLPYWHNYSTCGVQVTTIPSAGIPEECSFVISDGESTIFHAADSIYEPHIKRLQKFNIDIAFLPFSGWDVSGIIGLEVDKKWQPDWQDEARRATALGARYIVPASCDQLWATESLSWLNDRTHPGKAEDFVKAVNIYNHQSSDIKTEAIVLNPGSSWCKHTGFYITPKFSRLQHISEPAQDANSVPVEKVIVMGQNFVKKRRQQLLANLLQHPGVLLLLAAPYTIHLSDIDCYLRMQLLHPQGLYRLGSKPDKSTIVHISSNDAYNLFSGKIDAEIMVMGGRTRVSQNKTQWDLIKVYAWEYLFVKDDYSELQLG